MENLLKEFWSLYDQYVVCLDKNLRPRLSELLKDLENKDRIKQILRPEKNWNKIVGWQVLRNQNFIFSDINHFDLIEGELITWSPQWDRDIFITRVPILEIISGKLIKPGFKLSHDDKREVSEYEWNKFVLKHGLTDERGLYLPIFDISIFMKICDHEISSLKPKIKYSLAMNLISSEEVLKIL